MLNQIKGEVINDEETAKSLLSQNSHLMFQVGRRNDEVTDLIVVINSLQKLATQFE